MNKSKYPKSVSESTNLAQNLDLRRRALRALDKNRNQRQARTLLVHYAQIVRRNSVVAGGVSRSFAVLSRTSDMLEQWRSC